MPLIDSGPLAPDNKSPRDVKTTNRDLAYGVIRRSILLGHAAHGTQVNERIIAEKLGISRVPVREALLCLHGEGLISRSKRGLEVVSLSSDEAEYQTEFRAIIECSAARLAVDRITEAELDRLYELIAHQRILERSRDWDAFRESDLAFHHQILAATDNPFITRLTGTLAMGQQRAPKELLGVPDNHQGIVDALSKRDADEAERLMYEHITNGPFHKKFPSDSATDTADPT